MSRVLLFLAVSALGVYLIPLFSGCSGEVILEISNNRYIVSAYTTRGLGPSGDNVTDIWVSDSSGSRNHVIRFINLAEIQMSFLSTHVLHVADNIHGLLAPQLFLNLAAQGNKLIVIDPEAELVPGNLSRRLELGRHAFQLDNVKERPEYWILQVTTKTVGPHNDLRFYPSDSVQIDLKSEDMFAVRVFWENTSPSNMIFTNTEDQWLRRHLKLVE